MGGFDMNFIYNVFVKNKIPLLVFITLIFVFGIGFGSIAVKTVDYSIKQDLFKYFNDFVRGFEQVDYQQSTFVNESIKFNLLNILVIWVFGFSVVLMPLIPVLVFFKGFVLGFTIGFLVSEYNIKGIIISIVTIFPQNIFIFPVYILAGLIAISFTFHVIRYYRGRERYFLQDFIDYSLRMLVLAVVLLGGTLVETYISPRLFAWIIKYF